MGFKFSFSAEVPVRKSPGTDGQGARYRPPSYFIPPHQKGRADSKNGENRCSHTHSEVWTVRRPGCIKLESERGPVHFHMLFLDGVYTRNRHGKTRFQRTIAPNQQELAKLIHTISHRVARFLERQGILERDEENSYLQLDGIDEDPMQQLIGCSVSYRIALGPQQGRKVFTLQTLPSVEEDDRYAQVAKEAGFSLHAGVAAQAWERDKLERLCRYISRPAVSEKRLSLTSAGNIRYQLKTPYRDGTTHVIFEPLDFISKLASLVPKPRVNLTRFHGVFAPNSKHRTLVTPARRGKNLQEENKTPEEKRRAMSWAQRLKRVFNIDVETCDHCGGSVKVIACVEDQAVIDKILSHLEIKGELPSTPDTLPEARAPPPVSLFY